MINETLNVLQKFLQDSDFILAEPGGPFVLVAQNVYTLVFATDASEDLTEKTNLVVRMLSIPFRGKQFGPKSMEMYCVFITDRELPIPTIEKCEQDLRVCRKIVLSAQDNIWNRLAFLRPLNDVLARPSEPNERFWVLAQESVTANELEFLRSVEDAETSLSKLEQEAPGGQ
jgi:hypothetical protein